MKNAKKHIAQYIWTLLKKIIKNIILFCFREIGIPNEVSSKGDNTYIVGIIIIGIVTMISIIGITYIVGIIIIGIVTMISIIGIIAIIAIKSTNSA